MLVEHIVPNEPSLTAARALDDREPERLFGTQEFADMLGWTLDQGLEELERLEEADLIWLNDSDPNVSIIGGWGIRTFARLTLGRQYEVLGICGRFYRLLNDSDEPILYPAAVFQILDPNEPDFWFETIDDDGDRWAGPRQWSQPGFIEDYHDSHMPTRWQFWREVRALYPFTWAERSKTQSLKELVFKGATGPRMVG